MIPQKSQVVFQVRFRFAGAVPRKSCLLCSLALARRHKNPRFLKIVTYAPRFHGHTFRINSAGELDSEVKKWMREAYAVGEQNGLRRK